MKLKASSGIDIPDGVYPATLLGVAERENRDSKFDQKSYLQWKFCVYEDDGLDHEMTANSSLAFGQKAKARKWIETIVGRRLTDGEEVDLDEICPIDCQVAIKKDLDSGFCRIEDVLGPKKKGKAKAPLGSHTPPEDEGVLL